MQITFGRGTIRFLLLLAMLAMGFHLWNELGIWQMIQAGAAKFSILFPLY